jgi:phage regulator Rha-like protein
MKTFTIAEIAEEFGVSERTILRQIQTISDKLKKPYSKGFIIDEALKNFLFSDNFQTSSDTDQNEYFDYYEAFTTDEYIEFQKRINQYPVLKEYIENLKEQIEFLRFNTAQQNEIIKDLSAGIKQRNFIEAKEKGLDKP